MRIALCTTHETNAAAQGAVQGVSLLAWPDEGSAEDHAKPATGTGWEVVAQQLKPQRERERERERVAVARPCASARILDVTSRQCPRASTVMPSSPLAIVDGLSLGQAHTLVRGEGPEGELKDGLPAAQAPDPGLSEIVLQPKRR